MAASHQFDTAMFRAVLGRFASGVTVITAADDHGPIGFTCQAFTSLSLDPPLVAFCPSVSSTSYRRARAAGLFCVNILSEDQPEAAVAFSVSGSNKYDGIGWSSSPNGAPVLDGVIAWVACELVAEHPGGDHWIVVCRVTDIHLGVAKPPLVYFEGDFGSFER